MRHVPIAEFKDTVSELVGAAVAGEDVVITRHGRDDRAMADAAERLAAPLIRA